ncbi:MAG TPA: hypothetical protein VHX62_09460 [Solirubrobacteraceae bacterium]|jgi:hypothetical protein|nr:hypothetical protein [Solirubrobacteraceae bacterium]
MSSQLNAYMIQSRQQEIAVKAARAQAHREALQSSRSGESRRPSWHRGILRLRPAAVFAVATSWRS